MEYGNRNTEEDSFYWIKFQEGPIKEVGINGCQTPEIITVLIDELERLNVGEFETVETEYAIVWLMKARQSLGKRTSDREARGVEGTQRP